MKREKRMTHKAQPDNCSYSKKDIGKTDTALEETTEIEYDSESDFETVLDFEEWAFYNCNSLVGTTIPNSVASIGSVECTTPIIIL
jgi:hypothetical protein